jgi:threonine dehydrogenase-like Zn-dependent dehydrogenase
MAEATALWFTTHDHAELLKENLPRVTLGWCKVEALYSGISPGTERLVYSGEIPEDLHAEMRCPYMGGEFPFPVKYGYSLVGKITGGPKGSIGKTVHMLHPHQDQCIVRLEDTFPVPPRVPPTRATLASNLETAINAIWDSNVTIGERALLVGFGAVGSLVARLLSFIAGVEVHVADTSRVKIALAEKMGFEASHGGKLSGDFDLAFHASGSSDGLQLAIDMVGFEGRIIEVSWYGTRRASLSLGGSFHSQRKTIYSSQVSTLSLRQRPRWDHARRRRLVFELLERTEFDHHITHSVPFTKLPDIYAKLKRGPAEGLSYLVHYKERGR